MIPLSEWSGQETDLVHALPVVAERDLALLCGEGDQRLRRKAGVEEKSLHTKRRGKGEECGVYGVRCQATGYRLIRLQCEDVHMSVYIMYDVRVALHTECYIVVHALSPAPGTRSCRR